MAYATSLAAELRKRQMQLELKTTSDVRPKPKVARSHNVTGSGSAEEPVIVIDLSSSDDEGNAEGVKSTNDGCNSSSPNKHMSLEPDAKKQKVELSDTGAIYQQTLPAPIVDDALLSSIPMPPQPPSVSAVTVEQTCSPVVAEEKLPPVPALSQEPASLLKQHSTPVEELKISPVSFDQAVTTSDSDASYAFRRLTELPMPPASPDDECESPSENSR